MSEPGGGVTFHDGSALTADDVSFTIERAKPENSDLKELRTFIVEVRPVDDHTVEFVTDGPKPMLPAILANLPMVDRDRAEANDAVAVQNFEEDETAFAVVNADGTDPFRLVSREPDARTVLERNDGERGMDMFHMEVSRIE
jgi:peptide/nickel transport system substrate-binding protein